MNRADRRKSARRQQKAIFEKSHKGASFHEILATIPNVEQPEDHSTNTFCWRHTLTVTDPGKLTADEKKKFEGIRLVPFKGVNPKTGKLEMGRMCPRCGNTVFISENRALQNAGQEGGIEGYTGKQKEDTINV